MSKREAILDAIADFILARGIEAATLRAMAEAAGQSDRMLLYYFKDKQELIAAALDVISSRMMAELTARGADAKLRKAALHERLDAVILQPAIWPHLRVWLEITVRAARGDEIYRAKAAEVGQAFHGWIDGQLATPSADQRRAEATEIMLGLQGIVVLQAAGLSVLVDELI